MFGGNFAQCFKIAEEEFWNIVTAFNNFVML